MFWSNFKLPIIDKKDITGKMNFESKYQPLKDFHQITNFDYKGKQIKLKILRNLVDYEAGKTILQTALKIISEPKEQLKLNL